MPLIRDSDDYSEIILTVGAGASIYVVIESALQFAIIEGSIVRFTFNDTEVIIDPTTIRDYYIEQYKALRRENND